MLPIVFLLHAKTYRHGVRASFLSDVQQIYGTGKGKYILSLLIKILIVSLAILALARPVNSFTTQETEKNGIDIVFLLDISKSMLAEDITPNRIEAAKKVISDFVGKLVSDRVGIILFAGKPFASVPLTFDYSATKDMLSEATTDSVNQTIPGLSGTAIGDGILSATDMLERASQASQKRTKTIILLTDGEANVGVDPALATKYAAEHHIRIYTVGIGKTEGTPLYITNPQTGEKQYFTDQTGKPIIATIDEKSLQNIAASTGGNMYLASDSAHLQQIFETLASLEKTPAKNKTITTNIPLSGYLIIPMLLLFLVVAREKTRVVG